MNYSKSSSYLINEITENQPFPKGVCGCKEFRIPGIITLTNGNLFAVADARWNDAEHDYGGIDTIFSVSDDGGRIWHPGFAAMFPDSNGTPSNPDDATTIIDPCVVQDKNNVIHILVNINPTGITTGLGWPCRGNGFIVKNDKKYLALTDDYFNAGNGFEAKYYVDDFVDGYAQIYTMSGEKTSFSIDSYFNIYSDSIPLYQKQIDTDNRIQQNIFYRDSVLHVLNTMFTLHLATSDEGKTWSTEIISDTVKMNDEDALISSPGNGVCTPGGTLLMPFYTFSDEDYRGDPLIIYSHDCGKIWHRTPKVPRIDEFECVGESKIVALSENLWRVFLRNKANRICYADYNNKQNRWMKPVMTDIKIHSDCNLSAILFDDKIYVSCPEGKGDECSERCNGKLYEFSLDSDNNMKLETETLITNGSFSYSCLTAFDKKILVLYDTCGDGKILFKRVK